MHEDFLIEVQRIRVALEGIDHGLDTLNDQIHATRRDHDEDSRHLNEALADLAKTIATAIEGA